MRVLRKSRLGFLLELEGISKHFRYTLRFKPMRLSNICKITQWISVIKQNFFGKMCKKHNEKLRKCVKTVLIFPEKCVFLGKNPTLRLTKFFQKTLFFRERNLHLLRHPKTSEIPCKYGTFRAP